MAQVKQIIQKQPANPTPAVTKKVVKKAATAATSASVKKVAPPGIAIRPKSASIDALKKRVVAVVAKKQTEEKTVKYSGTGKRADRAVAENIGQSAFEKPASISEEQWELPAGIKTDGTFASLGEVLSQDKPIKSLESLSSDARKMLVIERIKRQRNYPAMHMLGIGEVNKKRAIAEVLAGSSAGRFIQESEQNVIQLMKMQFQITQ